jgi:hypothetical protein
LDVNLKSAERWTYTRNESHAALWIASHLGKVVTPAIVSSGELAVLEENGMPVE